MRRIHVLLLLTASCISIPTVGVCQQAVRWEATLDNAQRVAGQSNRLVLVHFWAPWCGACKRMEAEVYSQPAVAAALAAEYVPVKVNTENFPSTAQQFGISTLPTTLILTPRGEVVDTIRGAMDASKYLARIGQVAADAKRRNAAAYAQIPGASTSSAPVQTVASQPVVPQASATPVAASAPIGIPAATAAVPVATTSGLNDNRYVDYFNRGPAQPSVAGSPSVRTAANGMPPLATGTASVGTGPGTPVTGASPSAAPTTPPISPTAGSMPVAGSRYSQPVPTGAAPVNSIQPMGAQPFGVAAGQSPVAAAPAAPPVAPAVATQPNPPYASQPGAPPMMASRAAAPSANDRVAPPAGGNSPLCLDGYCPVTLCEKQQWSLGDRRWGAVHRGRTYLFSGEEEQRRFFADPDRYAPAISGNDLIVAVEQGQNVPGMREHGVYFSNRVYLFASEESLEKFSKNPNLYANHATEAMRANNPTRQVQ